MRFEDYTAQLRTELEGKDPRRVVGSRRGAVVFLLRDEVDALRRLTIRIERNVVHVVDGAVTQPDEPMAVIRGKLEDCLSFFALPRQDVPADRLQIFGDTDLLTLVGALAASPRTATSIQFGPSSK